MGANGMSFLPEDDKARKMIPLFEYFTRYFPKAHREVTKVCVVNNARYNPDKAITDINWARGKSPQQLGSAMRHILEREIDGKVFEAVPPEVAKLTGIERIYVLAEAMWRIGAQLEKDIENVEAEVEEPDDFRLCSVSGALAPREYCDCEPCQKERLVIATRV